MGGDGRVGAERLIIYETDGMANQGSTPGNGFSSGSYYNSYYQIQPGQPLNSAGYSETTLLADDPEHLQRQERQPRDRAGDHAVHRPTRVIRASGPRASR